MAVIIGTAGADTIDVTGDVGTLNGTPQGGPITGIDGQGSFDTITVSTSTVSGSIDSGAGGMDLTVTDSTIGSIDSSGTSDITVSNSSVNELSTGSGVATVTTTNTDFNIINSSVGDLMLNMTGGSFTGSYAGGGGNDALTFTNATIANNVAMDASSGNDTLTFNDTTIGDNLFLQFGTGDNTINIGGDTTFGTNAVFDALNSGQNQINLPDGTVLTIDGLGSFTVGTDPLPSGENLHGSFVLPNGSGASFTDFDQFGSTGAPVCFTDGTLILTPSGDVPIETLAVGDLVMTATGKAEPILWIGSRMMEFYDHQSKHRPVQIKAGALGAGRPMRDLAVSPQHCLLMDMPPHNPSFGPNFGIGQAFVRAKFLTRLPGVRVMERKTRVRYITFLLSRHRIVRANGAWSESFYPGPMALRMLSEAHRREIKKVLSERPTSPDAGYGAQAARVLTCAETEPLIKALKMERRGKPLTLADRNECSASLA